MSKPFVRVATPGPFAEPLDYLAEDASVQPGCRVVVPLGKRKVVGLVVERSQSSRYTSSKIRSVLAAIDQAPLIDKTALDLLLWVSRYYHHPIGDVVGNAMPGMLKRGADVHAGETCWALTQSGQGADPAEIRRAPKQQEVLAQLFDGGISGADLTGHPEWRQPLRRLAERGWAESRFEAWKPPAGEHSRGPALNDEQASAVKAITATLGGFAVQLLQGVTGSGKTEVYLQAIEAVPEASQILILVPEIGLTPQLLNRFSRLGRPLVSLHSGMTDADRRRSWAAVQSGAAKIVIGTRSAVFTPMPDLAMVIIDEEHDGSLKQQEGLRYHARDVAVRRAQMLGIPVVMGTATPSLESLANVEAKRYQLLELKRRASDGNMPSMRTIDLRAQPMSAGLSEPLIAAMHRHLKNGNQVILFLNRRGFAPALLCHACGWHAECRRCDARMTIHAGVGRIRCHHCGADHKIPEACPECKETDLIAAGQGTERLEEKVRVLFPELTVLRLDRDSTKTRGSFELALQQIQSGAARIIIGTQMLAKGHDFPNVTLAAVINADGGLFAVDFRAAERMAQLVTQVAGRAGRGTEPGEVLIQTHQPDHEILAALMKSGYPGFAATALRERREYGLPPYSYLALMRAEAATESAARSFLKLALQIAPQTKVSLWGPAPAPMLRRGGRYRYQLLINASSRKDLHALLAAWLPAIRGLSEARKVRWSVDVDPQDLY